MRNKMRNNIIGVICLLLMLSMGIETIEAAECSSACNVVKESEGKLLLRDEYNSEGKLLQSYQYDYDSAGKLTRVLDYDGAGKLVGELEYGYDSAGKLTRVKEMAKMEKEAKLSGKMYIVAGDSAGQKAEIIFRRKESSIEKGVWRWEVDELRLAIGHHAEIKDAISDYRFTGMEARDWKFIGRVMRIIEDLCLKHDVKCIGGDNENENCCRDCD